VNVGALRERCTVQVPSTSAAADGEYGAPTWKKLASVSAEVVTLSGRERLQAQAMQSAVAYRVRLRYRNDVTPVARIVCLGPDYAGSTMQIHAVVKNHRAGSMELDCSEVLSS
jgi:SPP1 family predicted phage head-tail adaptor